MLEMRFELLEDLFYLLAQAGEEELQIIRMSSLHKTDEATVRPQATFQYGL